MAAGMVVVVREARTWVAGAVGSTAGVVGQAGLLGPATPHPDDTSLTLIIPRPSHLHPSVQATHTHTCERNFGVDIRVVLPHQDDC